MTQPFRIHSHRSTKENLEFEIILEFQVATSNFISGLHRGSELPWMSDDYMKPTLPQDSLLRFGKMSQLTVLSEIIVYTITI